MAVIKHVDIVIKDEDLLFTLDDRFIVRDKIAFIRIVLCTVVILQKKNSFDKPS